MGRKKKFRDARLGLAACKDAVKPAFEKWAKLVGRDVMDIYSTYDLTPVLTGALRSDGSFFIGSTFAGKTKKNLTGEATFGGRKSNFGPATSLDSPPPENSNTMTVIVNTPYATNPGFRYRYGPEYLLLAFKIAYVQKSTKFAPEFMKSVKREVKKAW